MPEEHPAAPAPTAAGDAAVQPGAVGSAPSAPPQAGVTPSAGRFGTELPVIERLRLENAPPAEWRREALLRDDGSISREDFGRILEASLVANPAGPPVERIETLQMLAANYIRRAFLARRTVGQDGAQEMLEKARSQIDEISSVEADVGGGMSVDSIVTRGFLALAFYTLDKSKADEMRRAEMAFSSALKIDATLPRALMGKALGLMHSQQWAKALPILRQVLARAAPQAPRSGIRLQTLKSLRFLLAMCFGGVGRFEQTHGALSGVVTVDPSNVESLCALAHLEAKTSADGVGKSMEYLSDAAAADQNHPVVLLQLANHAFYCGLEDGSQDGDAQGSPTHFQTASSLLQRVLANSKSAHVQAEAHYQLGRLAHKQGRQEEAHTNYLKCKTLNPEHCANLHGFAQTCIKKSKFAEGVSALETVRRLKGDVPEAMRLLAYLYLRCGDKGKEASSCTATLLKADAEDVEVWMLKAEAEDQIATAMASEKNKVASKGSLEAYEKVCQLLEKDPSKADSVASPQLWNNLGTMRHMQGELAGAKAAYDRGLELAEARLVQTGVGPAEMKDLHVARLTMRVNRAWLAESSGDNPDYLQATQEYISMREEHGWYPDCLLQLGAQWRRLGDMERAAQTFDEATRHGNHVMAALMAAETFRRNGEFSKALDKADIAAKRAGAKEFHYAHVYLGNLHHEVASLARTNQRDRDKNLYKALHHFTKALQKEKDSHYAANGIGMVFAHRGKLDFARRTFQSVVQHNAMPSEASVYINLAHTYLRAGGENLRKAAALYETAKKLSPLSLEIRLYMAKTYFGMKEYERVVGILSDATHLWPENVIVQYNLAFVSRTFGGILVTSGQDDDNIAHMMQAVELLNSAVRLYTYVELRWAAMSSDERRAIATSKIAPSNLIKEISQVDMHKDYSQYMRDRAQAIITTMKEAKVSFEKKMKEVFEVKNAQVEEKKKVEEEERIMETEKKEEMEDQAIRLMTEGMSEIELGKNLEAAKLKEDIKQKPPKEPKAKAKARDGDGGGRRSKKEKKKEKKKKKKKDKKKRKHGEDSDDSDDDEGQQGEGPPNAEGSETREHAGEGEEGGGGVALPEKDAGEDEAEMGEAPAGDEEMGSDDEADKKKAKKDKKKDKKEKKDKKKKDKKDKKKKRRTDDESAEGSEGDEERGGEEGEQGVAGGDMEDVEEELFGPA